MLYYSLGPDEQFLGIFFPRLFRRGSISSFYFNCILLLLLIIIKKGSILVESEMDTLSIKLNIAIKGW